MCRARTLLGCIAHVPDNFQFVVFVVVGCDSDRWKIRCVVLMATHMCLKKNLREMCDDVRGDFKCCESAHSTILFVALQLRKQTSDIHQNCRHLFSDAAKQRFEDDLFICFESSTAKYMNVTIRETTFTFHA